MATRSRLIEWPMTFDIDGQEVECEVACTVTGRYSRAILYGDNACPAEGPEIEIDCVTDPEGTDVLDLLSKRDLTRIEEEGEARVAGWEQDAADAESDNRRDAARDERNEDHYRGGER